MTLVGLTGGIGSGKSYIASIFEHLDVPVYYADDRSKKIMTDNSEVVERVKGLLGQDAYFENGRLNKQYIAQKIFSDFELKKKLEAIVHPAVKKDFSDWVDQNKDEKLLIKESALLIESGSYKEMDFVVVVSAPVDLRIKRVMVRDKKSKEEVIALINSQLSDDERIKFANFVIDNSGDVLILSQIVELLKKIKVNVI